MGLLVFMVVLHFSSLCVKFPDWTWYLAIGIAIVTFFWVVQNEV